MATLIPSAYCVYDMTADEELGASILTQAQKQFIQNLLTQAATARISLVPEPESYASFIQSEAHYKGKMEAFQYLLDCSDFAERTLFAQATDTQ